MYKFAAQHAHGRKAETYLDELFRRWWTVVPASGQQQRRGIDRIWRGRVTGMRTTVEYKCDRTAASTGNAFVELQSSDRADGWALTSRAGHLVYYVPGKAVYVVSVGRLRDRLDEWTARYEMRRIHNDGYSAAGLLVPLPELEQISTIVLEIDCDGNPVRNRRGSAVPQAARVETSQARRERTY